jgi:hypothetical protein
VPSNRSHDGRAHMGKLMECCFRGRDARICRARDVQTCACWRRGKGASAASFGCGYMTMSGWARSRFAAVAIRSVRILESSHCAASCCVIHVCCTADAVARFCQALVAQGMRGLNILSTAS